MAERLTAVVRGRVQMVGYRMFVEMSVARLNRAGDAGSISGAVRNLPDGASVEVVAEGPRDSLESLLGELRIGPAHAIVREVDAAWGAGTGEFNGFATIY